MAILFAVAGLYGNWMLIFVALFIFIAGRAEANAVRAKARLRTFSVGDAMRHRTFHMVPAESSVADAARAVLFNAQEEYPVIENRRLVGMLAKRRALQVLADGYGHLTVGDVMRRNVPTLDQNASLADSLDQMQVGNHDSLPVAHGGQLVGVISTTAVQNGAPF